MREVLVSLAVLACPVGMLVMGWAMVKGMRGERARATHSDAAPPSVDELKAEHRRLAAEIERIEGGNAAREVRASESAPVRS